MRKCLKKKNKYRSFLEKCITGKSMKALISLLILSLCMQGNIALAGENVGLIQENDLTAQEEKAADTVDEIQEPTDLYAQSAVLMDAESGRVLFAKEGNKERAMASTTKIMTCILVLEQGDLDREVTVSARAAAQPEVRLGAQEGERFRIRDLLYSLMLESHNDAAVVLAEAVGNTVEGFADMMNAKAEKIGCEQTYFVTPNGLDEKDETGWHHTTAEDLARMMKYCIMDSPRKEAFLDLTQTLEYQFTDSTGTRQFSCRNHNAFLQMMEGAISGKTGFTSDAGYCYVGALESEGRTYVVALLACGWPNHKGYKWADTKKLMTYGMESFHYREVNMPADFGEIQAEGAVPQGGVLQGERMLELGPDWKTADGIAKQIVQKNKENGGDKETVRMLLRDDEKIEMKTSRKPYLDAPVEKGSEAGNVQFFLDGEEIGSCVLVTKSGARSRDFKWCIEEVAKRWLL